VRKGSRGIIAKLRWLLEQPAGEWLVLFEVSSPEEAKKLQHHLSARKDYIPVHPQEIKLASCQSGGGYQVLGVRLKVTDAMTAEWLRK
jgi:hypothetical protein